MDPKDEKNTRLVELRERMKDLQGQILALAEKPTLTEEEEARYEDLTTEWDTVAPEFEKLEQRAARAAEIRSRTYRQISGLPDPRKPADEWFGVDVRTKDWKWARDGALRILEDRDATSIMSANQMDHLDKLVRRARSTDIARRIIVTENDGYRSAFIKMMTRGPGVVLTDEERVAMLRYEEYRAQAEGATTQGGFAIPVFIDPSVILTDQETDNPFLNPGVCRQETVNTNAWKGISAAGVSWSFDGESAETSDDSITLAQPSVTVFTARGFIPYTLEVGEDWPGFQAEMSRLLAAGYDELLVSKFTSGNGTTEPRGILTALVAQTTTEVTVTTDGAFGQEDVFKIWAALAQKYRRRASWMMSVGINNRIRQMGTATNAFAYTVDLTEGRAGVLQGRPVYENDYFADFTGTTGAASLAVLGDFQNYVVARRSGMNVELIPNLMGVTTGRPTGQRGWFAHARIGGNVVNNSAFKILVNT
jgi:HK97 family phage major capsid protein